MSRTRHDRSLAPTSAGTVVTAWDVPAGTAIPQHSHPVHQLTVASRSALALEIGGRIWVLPPSRALWIPAGTEHAVEAIGHAEMTTLWFEPDACPPQWAAPTVVALTELARALVDRLSDFDLTAAARSRSEGVLFDVIEPLRQADLALVLPRDERARRVAEGIVLDPGGRRTLAEWGRTVGASERTLMRAFRVETGLGFEQWRTRCRLTAALRLLLTDVSITTVASAVGYTSSSAFSAAFRRVLGAPPTSFRG